VGSTVGFGFLRSLDTRFNASTDDIYISPGRYTLATDPQ